MRTTSCGEQVIIGVMNDESKSRDQKNIHAQTRDHTQFKNFNSVLQRHPSQTTTTHTIGNMSNKIRNEQKMFYRLSQRFNEHTLHHKWGSYKIAAADSEKNEYSAVVLLVLLPAELLLLTSLSLGIFVGYQSGGGTVIGDEVNCRNRRVLST